jgi:diacylglycerol O-acyltransferase
LAVTKQVAWTRSISLDEIQVIRAALGATVNDVLVATMAGGLRRYMLERGDDPDSKGDIRVMIPSNIRPVDQTAITLGNCFSLVFLLLPIGVADPLERLCAVKYSMKELKQSPEAAINYQVLNSLGVVPGEVASFVIDFFASKTTAVFTNVIGPRQHRYFAGQAIQRLIFWVPQSGDVGMGISIFSYNNQVTLGVMVDDRLVPNPDEVITGFHAEFEELLHLARLTLPRHQASLQIGPIPDSH